MDARSVTADDAPQYREHLAGLAGLDNPVSIDITRRVLGWEPTHPGWIEDVRTGHFVP